ncbi:MAG TPA: hypothetical protein VEV17_07645 [Bryobacteraceae bacterium]|nr:hypothetical protein [Bryobacteraceae bacterium]
MVTRQLLIQWATAQGWALDRFGHLHKVEHEGLRHYRLKLSRIAAGFETQTPHGWVRVRSGYYKNLSITADGKIVGMKV